MPDSQSLKPDSFRYFSQLTTFQWRYPRICHPTSYGIVTHKNAKEITDIFKENSIPPEFIKKDWRAAIQRKKANGATNLFLLSASMVERWHATTSTL